MDDDWKDTKAIQLEHLAKSAEADIKFSWPVDAQPHFKVIPREWETVSSLRAKADLFREIASYFRVPPEMLPTSDAARAATEIRERGREMRDELIRDGWPADKIGMVHPVKGRKRETDSEFFERAGKGGSTALTSDWDRQRDIDAEGQRAAVYYDKKDKGEL